MFKLILLSLAGECTFALIGCLIVALQYKLPAHSAFYPLTYGTYFALLYPFCLVFSFGLGEWAWKRHQKKKKKNGGEADEYSNLGSALELKDNSDEWDKEEEGEENVVSKGRKRRLFRGRTVVAVKIIVTIAIAVAFSFLYHRFYPGVPPNLVRTFQKVTSSSCDARSPFPPSDSIIQSISSKHTCCFYDFDTGLPTDPSCPFAAKMCEVPWLADPFPTVAKGTSTNSTDTTEPCNCYHIVQDAAMMHILVNQLTLYLVMLIGGPIFWCLGIFCGGCHF